MPTRRDFLRAGAGSVALSLAGTAVAATRNAAADSCILLFLVGGPSHLDTWDMKPGAPDSVRGPFRPIQTRVPGVQICEHFPRLALRADRFAIVRSVSHDASPIHETGQQLLQTGRLRQGGVGFPHVGAIVSHVLGSRHGRPPFVIVPGPIGNTGVNVSHGQQPGTLGSAHAPCLHAAAGSHDRALDRYGRSRFGRSCLQARRLIERGSRLVTVNMFDTVFDQVTWDCHADGGSLPATLDDYRKTLCPAFDRACSALLDDLDERGMLERTLVIGMGEFGRTPRLNAHGGRDHWPGAWSILLAGGGIPAGQVIGATDRIGGEVRDRPIAPAQVAATVLAALGVEARSWVPADPI